MSPLTEIVGYAGLQTAKNYMCPFTCQCLELELLSNGFLAVLFCVALHHETSKIC